MAAQPRQGRPSRHRTGLDAGAIRLAHRNASSTKPEERSVGSSLNAAEPTDCTADSVLPPRHAGCASWFYQEDPQDAGGGACAREATDEGRDDMKKKNLRIGSSLDDFLKEEGILEEARATALK